MILLNPGPVTLTPGVREALTRGDWCHREPEFAALTRKLNAGLVSVYPSMAADYDAILMTGSGTAAVEAMLAGFAPASGGTLVVCNGVYGERMAAMLEAMGRPHVRLTAPWTEAPDPARIAQTLDAHPGLRAVAIVHHETTTGRLNDLAPIGALCRERGLAMLLDAVSSFGAEAIDAEAWNLVALAATANKCLHGVPGLSFVIARREAFTDPDPPRAPTLYLDPRRYHSSQHGDGYSPYTQAVQIAFALEQALDELTAEGGWMARRESYRQRARHIAQALDALGVAPLIPLDQSSCVLHAWQLPDGVAYPDLHEHLRELGFVIYAGQGELARRIFRIAHMGRIGEDDLDRLRTALREALGA